jgi:hypothetical protein
MNSAADKVAGRMTHESRIFKFEELASFTASCSEQDRVVLEAVYKKDGLNNAYSLMKEKRQENG